MKIKVRKENKDGNVRLETSGIIKEVLIKEDILYPEGESVAICFKGKDSSGIIELSVKELEELMHNVRGRMHLIKGFERLK